jgi:hypothetical protein
MSETVQANDGAMLPLSSLAQQFTYSGTFVSTITVLYQGNTYVQTFLNDGTNITYISGWVNGSAPQAQQVMTDESGNIMTDEDGNIMVTE